MRASLRGKDLPELGAFLLDLNGQLTCGGENERDGAITGGEERLPVGEKGSALRRKRTPALTPEA